MRIKKYLSILLSIMILLTSMNVVSYAGNDDNTVEINFETIVRDSRGMIVSGDIKSKMNGIYTITHTMTPGDLYLEKDSTVIVEPKDIVMVLDVSGSMNAGYRSRKTRIQATKEAAVDFINSLKDEYNVKIITYSSWANNKTNFLNVGTSKQTLINNINNLIAKGGTNTGDALRLAYHSLKDRMSTGNDQVLVFLTDGDTKAYTRMYSKQAMSGYTQIRTSYGNWDEKLPTIEKKKYGYYNGSAQFNPTESYDLNYSTNVKGQKINGKNLRFLYGDDAKALEYAKLIKDSLDNRSLSVTNPSLESYYMAITNSSEGNENLIDIAGTDSDNESTNTHYLDTADSDISIQDLFDEVINNEVNVSVSNVSLEMPAYDGLQNLEIKINDVSTAINPQNKKFIIPLENVKYKMVGNPEDYANQDNIRYEAEPITLIYKFKVTKKRAYPFTKGNTRFYYTDLDDRQVIKELLDPFKIKLDLEDSDIYLNSVKITPNKSDVKQDEAFNLNVEIKGEKLYLEETADSITIPRLELSNLEIPDNMDMTNAIYPNGWSYEDGKIIITDARLYKVADSEYRIGGMDGIMTNTISNVKFTTPTDANNIAGNINVSYNLVTNNQKKELDGVFGDPFDINIIPKTPYIDSVDGIDVVDGDIDNELTNRELTDGIRVLGRANGATKVLVWINNEADEVINGITEKEIMVDSNGNFIADFTDVKSILVNGNVENIKVHVKAMDSDDPIDESEIATKDVPIDLRVMYDYTVKYFINEEEVTSFEDEITTYTEVTQALIIDYINKNKKDGTGGSTSIDDIIKTPEELDINKDDFYLETAFSPVQLDGSTVKVYYTNAIELLTGEWWRSVTNTGASNVDERSVNIGSYNNLNYNSVVSLYNENLETDITDDVWDGRKPINQKYYPNYVRRFTSNPHTHDYATWTKRGSFSVSRFHTDIVIPAGFDGNDRIRMKSVNQSNYVTPEATETNLKYGNIIPINDNLFVYVYKKGELTSGNFDSKMAFWTGTSNQRGTVTINGKLGTKATRILPGQTAYNKMITDGWYCEAPKDNLGEYFKDNNGDYAKPGETYTIDILASDNAGGGGMDRPIFEIMKNYEPTTLKDIYVTETNGSIIVNAENSVLKNDKSNNFTDNELSAEFVTDDFVLNSDGSYTVKDSKGTIAGTITNLNVDGTFTFTPATNYNGQVEIKYYCKDGRRRADEPTSVYLNVLSKITVVHSVSGAPNGNGNIVKTYYGLTPDQNDEWESSWDEGWPEDEQIYADVNNKTKINLERAYKTNWIYRNLTKGSSVVSEADASGNYEATFETTDTGYTYHYDWREGTVIAYYNYYDEDNDLHRIPEVTTYSKDASIDHEYSIEIRAINGYTYQNVRTNTSSDYSINDDDSRITGTLDHNSIEFNINYNRNKYNYSYEYYVDESKVSSYTESNDVYEDYYNKTVVYSQHHIDNRLSDINDLRIASSQPKLELEKIEHGSFNIGTNATENVFRIYLKTSKKIELIDMGMVTRSKFFKQNLVQLFNDTSKVVGIKVNSFNTGDIEFGLDEEDITTQEVNLDVVTGVAKVYVTNSNGTLSEVTDGSLTATITEDGDKYNIHVVNADGLETRNIVIALDSRFSTDESNLPLDKFKIKSTVKEASEDGQDSETITKELMFKLIQEIDLT